MLQRYSTTDVNGITTSTWSCPKNGGTENCSWTESVPPPDCTPDEMNNLGLGNLPCYCPTHPTEYVCKKKPAYKEN